MKHGFTFIEVMIAMLILTVTVTTLSNLQFRALARIQRNDNALEKRILIKHRLLSFVLDDKKSKQLENMHPQTTKNDEAGIKLTTQLVEINKKSSLAPLKDLVYAIQSDGQWDYQGNQCKEKMISFMVRPPKKEEA